MARRPRTRTPKSVENITHEDATRRNLPSAEHQPLMRDEERHPIRVAYERRNRDLDPQLVWRGKDDQDWSDLVVNAPPLYIQERVHPKALVDDLMRQTAKRRESEADGTQSGFADLFSDFNGLPSEDAKTEFYQHDANWSNRMVLGDSLQVMASLAEREGLRGKVQCIYIDPPYGIRFNSNFQWSTTSRDVRDGNAAHITREPEQVKAFRDTWRDGIHSYLTYLRDRLTVARDLLTESGSVFVQIGDENVHRVRALMDEVFGEDNFVSQITSVKTANSSSVYLPNTSDFILWYARSKTSVKYRTLWREKLPGDVGGTKYSEVSRIGQLKDSVFVRTRFARLDQITSQSGSSTNSPLSFRGNTYSLTRGSWKTHPDGFRRLDASGRLAVMRNTPSYVRFIDDFPVFGFSNTWTDISGAVQSRLDPKVYVVQTSTQLIQRCLLMTTDPGDLVLDPTCGSGTAAYVAEQWGRRWITIDTSRVALALARARIMGARYSYYLLSDSRDGQLKGADITGREPSERATFGDIRQGFVYERVPHIMLRDIANNSEIDVIWDEHEQQLAPLRERLSSAIGQSGTLEEWEVPRELPDDWPADAEPLHAEFWEARIARQKAIDASIARNAEFEYLYDRPYEHRSKARVAGPFTVESISPHRMLEVDENDEVFDRIAETTNGYGRGCDFAQIILENLKTSGVQQAHKEDRIVFDSLTHWPGRLVCAEGRYTHGDVDSGIQRRAGIFIGPEFGTVSRPDLVEAAREAAEAEFDVLVACAFNYDAHTTEFERLGRVPVLKARMNADLHMADDLKNTGKGNLFVIFGEPDIDILDADDDQVQVRVNGVDVFHPNSGEVRSDGPDGIACWFIDTDYNEEAFFVRHAYFLGASDPYRSLKTTLKAEIDAEAWESLRSDVSRPFDKPESGRIAVKVINHLGDEVMKVFRVS